MACGNAALEYAESIAEAMQELDHPPNKEDLLTLDWVPFLAQCGVIIEKYEKGAATAESSAILPEIKRLLNLYKEEIWQFLR